MSNCLLLGDLHGGFHHLYEILKSIKNENMKIDYIIQCGDFGFYPHCFSKLNNLVAQHGKFNIPVLCIPGNHENFDFIKNENHKEWEQKYNLFYKSLGIIEEIDGSIIAFMGKALNVDRANSGSIDDRTTNYILNVEIHEFLEKAKKYPKIDLLITHSCPHSVGIGMVGNPMFFDSIEKFCHNKGHSTGRNEDCGDGALSKLYKGLSTLNLVPKRWVFAHFHQYKMKTIGNTDFLCIGCGDSSDGKIFKNPFIYDTKTQIINYHDKINLSNCGNDYHSKWLKEKTE